MKRKIITLVALLLAGFACADVNVNPDKVLGPIKPMNGVNNGPGGPYGLGNSQIRDNFDDYKAAKIPFARTHDAAFSECYGSEHTVDITAIFPDFSKKADDPTAYDFAITDWYLKRIRQMGTEVFFRLGQKIEHHVKKYGIMPPADFKKWAKVCEHIIRHYNEGWADGHQWNIRYWEIWNEADLDVKTWNTNPRTWGGTEQQFFELYTITAKHLKKCFPNLHIGGPALAGNEQWADRFLAHMAKEKVPMDFFSWHIYTTDPKKIAAKSERMRTLADKYGYEKTETILNEWNYIRGWTDDYPYSLKTVHGIKGAAFTAATMIACQNTPVDILMYYDARPETPYNGLFDFYTFQPLPAYYSFYAWSRLAGLGRQVEAKADEDDLYAVAAKGDDGTLRVMVARYNENDNINRPKNVKIHMANVKDGEVTAHMVSSVKLYSETILSVKNGVASVKLEPNAVVVVEAKL
jgi:hypothetical protein